MPSITTINLAVTAVSTLWKALPVLADAMDKASTSAAVGIANESESNLAFENAVVVQGSYVAGCEPWKAGYKGNIDHDVGTDFAMASEGLDGSIGATYYRIQGVYMVTGWYVGKDNAYLTTGFFTEDNVPGWTTAKWSDILSAESGSRTRHTGTKATWNDLTLTGECTLAAGAKGFPYYTFEFTLQ